MVRGVHEGDPAEQGQHAAQDAGGVGAKEMESVGKAGSFAHHPGGSGDGERRDDRHEYGVGLRGDLQASGGVSTRRSWRKRSGTTGVGGAGGSCYDPGGTQGFEKVAEVAARDELGVARPYGHDEGTQQDDSKGGGDEPGADVPDFPCPEHAAGGQRADAWNGAAVRGAGA